MLSLAETCPASIVVAIANASAADLDFIAVLRTGDNTGDLVAAVFKVAPWFRLIVPCGPERQKRLAEKPLRSGIAKGQAFLPGIRCPKALDDTGISPDPCETGQPWQTLFDLPIRPYAESALPAIDPGRPSLHNRCPILNGASA